MKSSTIFRNELVHYRDNELQNIKKIFGNRNDLH